MGLMTGEFPPVDPATFTDMPYRDRIKALSRHWAEYGFGAPKITAVIYIVKLLVLYVAGGILVASLTSGLNPLHPSVWFDEPIMWQKFVLWTVLLEAVGVAGSWGPLAGHFKPMTGGINYWARPHTLRLPPWPDKVPFTKGDDRTTFDVALYLAFLASIIAALALKGHQVASLTNAVGPNHGLIRTASLIPVLVLLFAVGLRDKIIYTAARSEQYMPALVMFSFFPFPDMIVGAKLLILSSWMGAAVSKMNQHFGHVIPPMVSNTPWLSSKKLKRLHYRNFPEDLRPSKGALRLAHGPGTLVEFVIPLVLLFSHNTTVTLVAVVLMLGFHVFIFSTFPLAVPLEWNVMFMYITAFLFLGFPAHDGYTVGNMDTGLLILTLVGLLTFPILGNLRPNLVSFLPSMRQYAGNWASAMWAFAPGCEEKLNDHLVKPALMQKQQLEPAMKISEPEAEVVMQQLLGWRAMHSQGRALNSIMMNNLGDDMDIYTLREAEFSCNAIIGFNFGDGHLHNERMLQAIQKRCNFAPGEFIVVWIESEPIFSGRQEYWVMDAAVGVVERGSYAVADCVKEQPWLPNGPIHTDVSWRLAGYERVRHSVAKRDAQQVQNGRTSVQSQVTA
ncbi:MAG: hypothetical protein QOE61_3011 [Micromonosporaceae bacterium]|nr:hypothetical protein [Micromonosporaceae bacterium]